MLFFYTFSVYIYIQAYNVTRLSEGKALSDPVEQEGQHKSSTTFQMYYYYNHSNRHRSYGNPERRRESCNSQCRNIFCLQLYAPQLRDQNVNGVYTWSCSCGAFPQLQIKEITRRIYYISWLWSGYKQYIHTNFLRMKDTALRQIQSLWNYSTEISS